MPKLYIVVWKRIVGPHVHTGCSLKIVFYPNSLQPISLHVGEQHIWYEIWVSLLLACHFLCNKYRQGRDRKILKILWKKNTISNEHPVNKCSSSDVRVPYGRAWVADWLRQENKSSSDIVVVDISSHLSIPFCPSFRRPTTLITTSQRVFWNEIAVNKMYVQCMCVCVCVRP